MNAWFGLQRPVSWLVRRLIFLWVRTRTLPDPLADLGLRDDLPICYVLDLPGFSDALVVDEVCKRAQMARPSHALDGSDGKLPAIVYLRALRGLFVRRADPRLSPGLDRLYRYVLDNDSMDVQLVPVSVFWGRSPDKEDSSFKALFSSSWSIAGRLRKTLTIMLHGRNTLVQFSKPVSLRQLADEGVEKSRALRKLSRVLRVHFRRLRVATIGPDLSHRRTMVNELLAMPAVRREIENQAQANNWSIDKARAQAGRYAYEIAADYSYPVIRFFDRFLGWLWNKLFRGIEMHHFEQFKEHVPGNEIIYVPCHRSHVDYLLLSYLLYQHGLAPPHIAAGVNLNLPVVGTMLRRAGAFFLRRSFKGNRLYARVFDAYLRRNIARGVSIEYFIEGTRSRTGRLLTHKAGLLAMTVQSYLKDQQRPVIFVPIYIGYERLMEGRAYLGELSGKVKRKESLGGILRSARLLRQNFGKVYVNFARPLKLTELLDRSVPDWRERDYRGEDKPEFMKTVVDELGTEILLSINRATAVSPVNLLALALLATPKQAMTEADLTRQIDSYLTLLREAPYSDQVTLPDMNGPQVVAYCEGLGIMSRRSHPLGDILRLEDNNAVLMTYFRNNVLHLVALPAMIACCFIENRSMTVEDVSRLCALASPFVERELTIELSGESLPRSVAAMADVMVRAGLLTRDDNGRLRRPASRNFAAVQLSVLAQNVLQTLERYYLAIALLQKHGSGVIRQSDLEKECKLMAERMSMLHELDAPEFFDRRLFRGFIDELRSRGVVWSDSRGCLAFDARINEVERDAQTVLSEQIRHSILQVTHS